MTLTPAHLSNEQRNVLQPVALAYRRAIEPEPPKESAATGRCWSTGGYAPTPRPTNSPHPGQVNRMVAAAINADAKLFWHGPDV